MIRFNRVEKLTDVNKRIQEILVYCIKNESPLGYFAALYTLVANSIEKAILNKEFDDNEQLAKMDINFVNYYVHAMNCAFNKNSEPAPAHWQIVIDASKNPKYLVLEHLLIAMNAHIDYDLCNAVNDTVSSDKMISFKTDFMKVNDILFSLLDEVQNDISNIFHPLKWYLRFGQQLDDKIIALVMGNMRNDAFGFACTLSLCNESQKTLENLKRIEKVVGISEKIIFHKKWWINMIISIIRSLETGTTKSKIDQLLK